MQLIKQCLVVLAGFFFLSAFVNAENNYRYLCKHDNAERVISVMYLQKTPVPCEVTYKKADDFQVLWRAENTQGYCEAKADAFRQKQEDWGWSCELQSDGEPATTATKAEPSVEQTVAQQPMADQDVLDATADNTVMEKMPAQE